MIRNHILPLIFRFISKFYNGYKLAAGTYKIMEIAFPSNGRQPNLTHLSASDQQCHNKLIWRCNVRQILILSQH